MMKQHCLLTLTLFMLAVPQMAHAGRRHKDRHKRATQTAKPVTPYVKKKQAVSYPETVKKSRYRVDILAQLYLDDLVMDDKPAFKDKIPNKALAGVAFCQGAMLAADTLKAMGFDMDIFVHDVNTATSFPSGLIGNKQLDTTSLIIGAVGSKDIPELAGFAKKQHINFISALSSSDGELKDNQYFTLLQPSAQQHFTFIKKELLKKHPGDKVTLYYRTDVPADEIAYQYLYAVDSTCSIRKVLCAVIPDKTVLDILFDSTVTNVILMAVNDIAYADKLLVQLDESYPGYRFEVYGMPSWKGMPCIHKTGGMPGITINISAPFYFSQNSPAGKYIEHGFKAKFNGHTGEMVYRGYETVLWYAILLKKYGTIFNTHFPDNDDAAFTKFLIKPQWNKDLDFLYNQNEHLYLYRYQGGSYMIE
jgi:hypothetical protein